MASLFYGKRIKAFFTGRSALAALPVAVLVSLAAALLAAFGSTSTWAIAYGERDADDEIERFLVSGTVGDGTVTLILAAVSGLLILWRLLLPRTTGFVLGLAAVLLMVVMVVGMLNWVDVSHMPGIFEPGKYFRTGVDPGWGLILVTLSAAIGMVASAYQLWQDELR